MTRTVGFIFAHPDDETYSSASLIRQITDQGEQAKLLTATRGDKGKTGRLGKMTTEELAIQRELELNKAGEIIGLSEIDHLYLPDGKLETINMNGIVESIVSFINKHRLRIVVTFPKDGVSGHRDHIVIHHAVSKAVLSGKCPTVQKLYYTAPLSFRDPSNPLLLIVDVEPYWDMKMRALKAHESQILSAERIYGDLSRFPKGNSLRYEYFMLVWERGVYYPSKAEQSIFDGLVSC
jgi:LmbE family N-acetylglucosaminyl deacetylase